MTKHLIVILLFSAGMFAREQKVDSLMNVLDNAGLEKKKHVLKELFFEINNFDTDPGKKATDKLLKLTYKFKDKSLYLTTLIFSAKFYTLSEKIEILNKAVSLSEEESLDYLAGIAEKTKGMYFKENLMTDSAMIYSLKAKTIFEKTGDVENLTAVLHTIADLHYFAGLYEKAEGLYKEILKLKGDPYEWKEWRFVVINNDIGLIKIKQKQYDEAKNYFNASINYILSQNNGLLNSGDSARFCYIYRKLLEINIQTGETRQAEHNFNLSLAIAKKYKITPELGALYTCKGRLCFDNRNYDSALVFLKKAEAYNNASPDLSNLIDIYDGFTKTYSAINDYKNTVRYLGLLKTLTDSSETILYHAKYMNLFAEYNYNNYLTEIEYYKNRQQLLVLIISFITLSLIAIMYYFLKLRSSNRALVAKNIEIAQSDSRIIPGSDQTSEQLELREYKINKYNHLEHINEEITNDPSITKVNNGGLDEDIIKIITEGLENLIGEEKIYLNPDLTINTVSDKLGTNRTYLSKAIIQTHNTNFINYINSLRIKEAIRIITNGEHKQINIDGIAQKAGFNNRVSFNKAFQKYTGVSPSFFIRNANSEREKLPEQSS